MSDGSAAGALAEGEGASGASGAGGESSSGGEQQQQGSQVPDWMREFAPELRGDPDINRYKSAEDAAKAIKEIRAWGRGRIPLPGADDEAGWTELGSKLRPENADGYNFEVPEGQDPTLANSFKQFAWDTGMPPRHAEAAVKFLNQQTEAQLSKLGQDNAQELKGIEIEFGPAGYAQRIEAVNKMFGAAGIEGVDVANGLQHMLGQSADGQPKASAAATMKALFTLAEKTGELGKVDSVGVQMRMGTLTPEGAKAEQQRRGSDQSEAGKQWMAQARIPGTAEHAHWNKLNELQVRRG